MKLHKMTDVNQRVASAYYPQANELCERQNRTIKSFLFNPTQWPYIIKGVLFAHRLCKHSSTKKLVVLPDV